MARFAKISVGAGKTFDANKLSPEMQAAIKAGMADALKEQAEFKRSQIDTCKKTPVDLFGTREFLKNNYLYRMTGTILGIYSNSKEEAMYPLHSRRGRREAQRSQPLHHPVCAGEAASGERVLVHDHV